MGSAGTENTRNVSIGRRTRVLSLRFCFYTPTVECERIKDARCREKSRVLLGRELDLGLSLISQHGLEEARKQWEQGIFGVEFEGVGGVGRNKKHQKCVYWDPYPCPVAGILFLGPQ